MLPPATNIPTLLSPIFDRHDLSSEWRRVFLESFAGEEHDCLTWRQIRASRVLTRCLDECRRVVSDAYIKAFYRGKR